MRKKIMIGGALVCFLFLMAAQMWPRPLLAMADEESAVHIEPGSIEDSTLIIGTHLIYRKELDDYLYKLAVSSAEQWGQTKMYYKSELGDGKWYSISDADSVSAITTRGKAVSDDVVKELWLTHHTKSDGKTYELKSQKEIRVYEVLPPYDLRKLPQLQTLELRSRAGNEPGGLFAAEVQDEETKKIDKQLDAIGKLKEEVGEDKLLDRIMDRLDALRRNIVYTKVREELDILSDSAGVSDASLSEAIGDGIRQIEEALQETEASMLDEGETVMTELETRLQRKVIELAEGNAKEPKEYEKMFKSLAALENIQNGIYEEPQEELRLLKEELIPRAEKRGEGAKAELQFYESAKERLTQEEKEEGLELSKLYDEKEKRKQERLKALDENDLSEAKRLEELLEKLEDKIKGKEAELEERLSQGETLTEKFPEESGAANVQNMKEEALEILERGKKPDTDLRRLQEAVDGIGALLPTHPDAAGGALKELYQKMTAKAYVEESLSYEDILADIEKKLTDNAGALEEKLDVKEAEKLLEQSLADTGTQLAALSLYCEQKGSKELRELLKKKTEEVSAEQEAYLFPKVSDGAGLSYVSAKTAASYASFRYIWNSNKKEATLASRDDYYTFQAFDNIVERNRGKDTLSKPCLFRTTVYIPEDYAEQEFGIQVWELYGTGYCVLADENTRKRAAEICDTLREKGGE